MNQQKSKTVSIGETITLSSSQNVTTAASNTNANKSSPDKKTQANNYFNSGTNSQSKGSLKLASNRSNVSNNSKGSKSKILMTSSSKSKRSFLEDKKKKQSVNLNKEVDTKINCKFCGQGPFLKKTDNKIQLLEFCFIINLLIPFFNGKLI